MKKCFSLLLAALLLSACGSSESEFDTFSFTAEDAAEISALLDQIEGEQADQGGMEGDEGLPFIVDPEVILDASQAHRFDQLRTSLSSVEENTFRVTNAFLNVREDASVRSSLLAELTKGDRVVVLDYPDSRWAHIQLSDGRKGYVSTSYIAQMVNEEQLEVIKKKYEGQYEVNFAFLNVRDTPSAQGKKLGELDGDQVVTPLGFHDDWARVPFEGGEGFVSAEYLRPFVPTLIVRQENFGLPILHYHADEPAIAEKLVQHLAFLKSAGKKLITLSDFYELLLEQEERDIRLPAGSVLIAVSNVTPETIKEVADVLRASGVRATFFLKTSEINAEGISPQTVQSLVANGHDVQSEGHSEDDLRSLTNAQVKLDLAQSRQILEDLTGKDIFAVSYSRGGVNDRIAEQAVETGYLFGLTLAPSAGQGFSRSQFLRLPSDLITPTTTEGTLKAIVGE
jgi:peptidoglycan/xylan/chitin deacetylase (PgdA/CDA1 family)/uncharacterized protein YgiM (DUF1202 family)